MGVNGAGKDVPAVDFDELTDLIRCVARGVWDFRHVCFPRRGVTFRHGTSVCLCVSVCPSSFLSLSSSSSSLCTHMTSHDIIIYRVEW